MASANRNGHFGTATGVGSSLEGADLRAFVGDADFFPELISAGTLPAWRSNVNGHLPRIDTEGKHP